MSNVKIKSTLVFLLIIYTALSQSSLYGFVLCVENEGHIAIENNHNASVFSDLPSEDNRVLSFNQEKKVHNPCLDIPILTNSSKDNDISLQSLQRIIPHLEAVSYHALSEATLPLIQKVIKPLQSTTLLSSVFLPLKTIILII